MADDFGFGFDEAPAPEAPEAATAPAPAEEEEEFGMGFGEEVEAATAAVAEVKVADPEVGCVRVAPSPRRPPPSHTFSVRLADCPTGQRPRPALRGLACVHDAMRMWRVELSVWFPLLTRALCSP